MGLRELRRFQFTCDVCGTKAIHETTEAESRTDMIGGVSVSVSLADTQWREIVPRDLDECERFEAWAWARGLRKTIRKGAELPRRYLACSVCAARAAHSFGKADEPEPEPDGKGGVQLAGERDDERTIGVDPGADRPRAALVTGPEALAALGFGNPLETASTRGAVEAVARLLGVSPDEANELAKGCAHVRHEYHDEPDEGWLCDDCGRWRPKEDGQFPSPADDYAPETHLLAVELRALGMELPREIPNGASIPRCGLVADVGEIKAQPDGSVAGSVSFDTVAPFTWIDPDGNECQEWIKGEGGHDGSQG